MFPIRSAVIQKISRMNLNFLEEKIPTLQEKTYNQLQAESIRSLR